MGEKRKKVHHVTEVPDKKVHPVKYRLLQARWKLALWAVVYPVQVALALSLVICAIPVYLVLDQQGQMRAQQRQIGKLVHDIQRNRVSVTRDICAQLDRNARTSNAQLDLFKGIIVGSVKGSKPFEKTYRAFGLPPYKVRLKQALKTAHSIDRLKLPLPNCTKAIFNVRIK